VAKHSDTRFAGGWFAWKWVTEKSRSKNAEPSENMKQNSFQCNRREDILILWNICSCLPKGLKSRLLGSIFGVGKQEIVSCFPDGDSSF